MRDVLGDPNALFQDLLVIAELFKPSRYLSPMYTVDGAVHVSTCGPVDVHTAFFGVEENAERSAWKTFHDSGKDQPQATIAGVFHKFTNCVAKPKRIPFLPSAWPVWLRPRHLLIIVKNNRQ